MGSCVRAVLSVITLSRYNVSAHARKPYTSIIHVIWTTSEVPTQWKQSAESWTQLNAKSVYCHWNHSELEAFVADEYPWLLSTYLAYPYVIQRCDVSRYLLVYHYGGTYADLDVVIRVPMSAIFASAPVSAGVIVAPTKPFGIATEFIAARRPRDPVMRGVIAGLRRAAASPWYPPLPYTAVMYRTGPVYFTRLLNCYGGESGVFVIPWSNYYKKYIRNAGGASWHAWDGRIIWRLYRTPLRQQLYDHAAWLAAWSAAGVIFILVIRNRRFFVRYS